MSAKKVKTLLDLAIPRSSLPPSHGVATAVADHASPVKCTSRLSTWLWGAGARSRVMA